MLTVSSADRHTAVYTLTTVTPKFTARFPNYANEIQGLLHVRLIKNKQNIIHT